MWSSSPVLRIGITCLALGAAGLAVSGCTFTPVYGEHGVTQGQLQVSYNEPESRLDQIVIQDLSVRLGRSDKPGAPFVRILTNSTVRALTHTGTTKPTRQFETTVTVSFAVADHGKVVAVGTRTATAVWTESGQVLADEAARKDAEERAARAAGETVRLSILAALATPVR